MVCRRCLQLYKSFLFSIQAINKNGGGSFNQIDELLMGHLTQHAGIALRNADVYCKSSVPIVIEEGGPRVFSQGFHVL